MSGLSLSLHITSGKVTESFSTGSATHLVQSSIICLSPEQICMLEEFVLKLEASPSSADDAALKKSFFNNS